jgi:DNA-binding MarR family transcriptional regulator
MNRTMDAPPSGRDVIEAERRVHRILRSRFAEALVELGVSYAQFEVLCLLYDEDQLHPGEIGRRLLITRQSASHLVRQLERRVLVDVWPIESQSVGVSLNDDGRRRLRLCELALGATRRCLELLDAETRTRLLGDLREAEAVLRPRPRPWWVTDPF